MPPFIPNVSSVMGDVPGKFADEVMVCQYLHMTCSVGHFWYGGDPFAFSIPVLLMQLSFIFLLTRTIYFFIKPLKQGWISAQLLGGMMITSFFMSHQTLSKRLLPPGGRTTLETIADVGFVLHLFKLGVQIDPSLLKSARRSTFVMGLATLVVPNMLCIGFIKILPGFATLDETTRESLMSFVVLSSMTTFPVITSLLADLKILNSDVGRLASTVAMVADLSNIIVSTLLGSGAMFKQLSEMAPLLYALLCIVVSLINLIVVRPLTLRFARKTPEGHMMKESHIITILLVMLLTGFCSESLGFNAALGVFVLGIVIPDEPSLGASLLQKIDTLPTGILLPAKFAIGGMIVRPSSISGEHFISSLILELIFLLASLVKFTVCFGLAVYYGVPSRDALYFALVMCCKGIIDVSTFMFFHTNLAITDQEYALLVINMLTVTGIIRFLVGYYYDPSKRYLAYKKNSILNSQPDGSLKVLVCIHNEDNVAATINLLQAANPTRLKPITVFSLNLMELTGRAAAILVPNFGQSSYFGLSSQIVNVFSAFSQQNQGFVVVQHFTAIAPYASMHDDICTIAADKHAHIIIVPFHKQWGIDGSVGATSASIKMVNLNVMEKAPCSVGLLVDRGIMGGPILTGKSMFRISQLFVGGYDDREALACSSRMADHPNVSFTLVWLRPSDAQKSVQKEYESCLDSQLIKKFMAHTASNKEKLVCREEFVKDALDTTRVIQSLESSSDLFIVGRVHDPAYSQVTIGLGDWSECPELGVIGDFLVASNHQYSVLVVQQQPPGLSLGKGSKSKPVGSKVHPVLMESLDDCSPKSATAV